MNNDATNLLLEDIVRRESRSLLQYVHDSFPWTTPREREALAQLKKIIREELQGAAKLAQFLVRRQHAFPYLGPYPVWYTTINFVALEHLLPILVDNQRQAIAGLERDLTELHDAEAEAQVQQVIDMERRHLRTLEEMAAAHPPVYATLH